MARLILPDKGVIDAVPFVDLPPDACPVKGLGNVRRRKGADGVTRWCSREGLAPYIAARLPGAVQALENVGVATSTTVLPGATIDISGGQSMTNNTGSNAPRGCLWVVHPYFQLAAQLRDPIDTTANGGPVGFEENLLTGNQRTLAFCTYTTNDYGGSIGVRNVTRLHFCTSPTGDTPWGEPLRPAIQWSVLVEDRPVGGSVGSSPLAVRATKVLVYSPYVFVAANQYVYVFRASNGEYLARYNVRGWASKVVDLVFTYRSTVSIRPTGPDSGRGNYPWLHVVYEGSTTVSGPVTTATNRPGAYFRAGVADFGIDVANAAQPLTWTQSRFGADTTSVPNGENSLDFRLSSIENGVRGRLPLAAAAWKGLSLNVDGSGTRTLPEFVFETERPLFCVTTNTGFGPQGATQPPDGSTGYWNCVQLRGGDGSLTPVQTPVWFTRDVDANSKKANWQGTGWFNDIPYNASGALDPDRGYGPEASLNAIGLDHSTGNIFAAGAVVNGFNFYVLDGGNGATFFRGSTGDTVPQHCLAYDFGFNTAVVGVPRNSNWTGAAGRQALVLWMNLSSATPAFIFDLGVANTEVRGLAVNRGGWVAFTTDYVS